MPKKEKFTGSAAVEEGSAAVEEGSLESVIDAESFENTAGSESPENAGVESLENATGSITYTFTNDYMFRAILQRSNKVLKGLICSLLHLDPGSDITVEITNAIELGTTIDNKTFILDINVLLNDQTRINLEMQVINRLDWQDRSLSYLCREYDELSHGDDYSEASRAIQIGLLDFTLFPDYPEFYAVNKLMNIKNHHVYNDKFMIGVVDLTKIELATEEDKHYEIDRWARLFKATTWEDIKQLAEGNEYMMQAAQELYECNADKIIRQQCQARIEYDRYERKRDKYEADLQNQIKEKDQQLKGKDQQIENILIQREQDRIQHEQDRIQHEQDRIQHEQDRIQHEKDQKYIAELKAQLQKLQS